MKIKILQSKKRNKDDSFWYSGDIAEITAGKRIVVVVAAGDIRIHNKNRELVHDGFKERNNGLDFKLESDKDLKKIGNSYNDKYYWENNNWFECFYGYKGESLNDIIGDVVYSYKDAIAFGKAVLKSKDYEHLWKAQERSFK